jgi:hypothetical protein
MRAKMQLVSIKVYNDEQGNPIQENLRFTAVCKSGAYPADGSDEDNTFSKFTPNAELTMTVQNPALIGTMSAGEKYYVDFTRAD